jgi:hypothetical protein
MQVHAVTVVYLAAAAALVSGGFFLAGIVVGVLITEREP